MKLVADGLVDFEDGAAHLIGGKSKETGKIVFPMPEGGEAARYDPVKLKTEGTLWSYTVQRFAPKSPPYIRTETPETFKPFAVGYVELEGQAIIETRIEIDDFSVLKVGLPMALTMIEFVPGVQTYAFRPA